MKKIKKQSGFTLVELLVVIAILAVLATVSVVGYTSFINKANNSNALTECKQAEDIVLSDLISTGKEVDAVREVEVDSGKVTFKYTVNKGKVKIEVSGIADYTDITGGDGQKGMNNIFPDTQELGGKFYVYNGGIAYLTSNQKGLAIWESEANPASPTGDINAEKFVESIPPSTPTSEPNPEG